MQGPFTRLAALAACTDRYPRLLRHHRNLRKSMESVSNLRQRNPMTDVALHRQLTTCIDDVPLLRPLTSYETRLVAVSCSLKPASPPSWWSSLVCAFRFCPTKISIWPSSAIFTSKFVTLIDDTFTDNQFLIFTRLACQSRNVLQITKTSATLPCSTCSITQNE